MMQNSSGAPAMVVDQKTGNAVYYHPIRPCSMLELVAFPCSCALCRQPATAKKD